MGVNHKARIDARSCPGISSSQVKNAKNAKNDKVAQMVKLFKMIEPMAEIVLVLVHQKMLGLMAEFVLASVQNLRKMTMTNDSGK